MMRAKLSAELVALALVAVGCGDVQAGCQECGSSKLKKRQKQRMLGERWVVAVGLAQAEALASLPRL